ncbi:hypothetical protein J6590_095511, partial [Homalodisca vitripennis]
MPASKKTERNNSFRGHSHVVNTYNKYKFHMASWNCSYSKNGIVKGARVPVGSIGGIEVVKSAGSVMVTTNTKCRLNVGFYQDATPWRVTSFRDNTGTCPSRSWYSSP